MTVLTSRCLRASFLWLTLSIVFNTADAADYAALEDSLRQYIGDKDARIGIALIIDGSDTISVKGSDSYPMLSVYKFPQALAVADYCNANKITLSDSIDIAASELHDNTWSPLRDNYGRRDLRLPLYEILEYSLAMSDNNACDILFRLIGGPAAADSLMKISGFSGIKIASTEADMHREPALCFANSSTPLDMARLFDTFYRNNMPSMSPTYSAIDVIMQTCRTGQNRLPAALEGTTATIAHKTGTGDRDKDGRLTAINDAGYITIPGGHSYAIAVFITASPYSVDDTEKIIANISGIVYRALARQ